MTITGMGMRRWCGGGPWVDLSATPPGVGDEDGIVGLRYIVVIELICMVTTEWVAELERINAAFD
jgi:hypothetical protein